MVRAVPGEEMKLTFHEDRRDVSFMHFLLLGIMLKQC